MARKSLLFIFCFALISNWVFAQDSTKVNWQEFYPLHIGDFWKYSGKQDHIDILWTRRVEKVDSMPNGKQYAKILNTDHIFSKQGYNYERVDSVGDVYEYYTNNQEYLLYKLNVCVGDTWPALSSGCWKVIGKYENITEKDTLTCITIAYSIHGEEGFFYKYLQEGLGLTYYQGEGEYVYYGLVGYCINGIAWGDTTMTFVNQMSDNFLTKTIILHQNYPNPFNQLTKIGYEIPKGGDVTLKIYNIKGQLVKQISNQAQHAGKYEINWDGKNESGEDVSSGIYFYQLKIGNYAQTKRLLLIR